MVDNARVKTEFTGGVVLATVRCEKITDFDVPALQADIAAAAQAHGWRLVLDLSSVLLMGSSGLGLLVALRKAAKAGSGAMVICGLNEDIRGMLRVTNLLKLFAIVDNREAAISQAGG